MELVDGSTGLDELVAFGSMNASPRSSEVLNGVLTGPLTGIVGKVFFEHVLRSNVSS